MAYVPINTAAYTAAFSGAVAGMAVSGWIISSSTSSYVQVTAIAGVFAEAFDQIWNSATALNDLESKSITSIVQTSFAGRGPGPFTEPAFLTRANWNVAAAACVALVLRGDLYFAGQGIVPGTPIDQAAVIVIVDTTVTTAVDLNRPEIFSGGVDGNLIINAGVTTLTRPTYYQTVRITGTGQLNRGGYPLYIQHFDAAISRLDAIVDTGNPGDNAIPGDSASNFGGPALPATDFIGASQAGGNGGDPSTLVGNIGDPGGDAGPNSNAPAGGAGGAGGNGAEGGGGAPGVGGIVGGSAVRFLTLTEKLAVQDALSTPGIVIPILGGAGGGGGSSGAGDTNTGGHESGTGGGGGGGARAGLLRIGKITTSALTPAGVISSRGGRGGNGATGPTVPPGNIGGGGGGGGGAGAELHCIVGVVSGPTVANFFSAQGGVPGTGAPGAGSGTAGASGIVGGNGPIDLIQLSKNTAAHSIGTADLIGT